jgi:hypothetical protein
MSLNTKCMLIVIIIIIVIVIIIEWAKTYKLYWAMSIYSYFLLLLNTDINIYIIFNIFIHYNIFKAFIDG